MFPQHDSDARSRATALIHESILAADPAPAAAPDESGASDRSIGFPAPPAMLGGPALAPPPPSAPAVTPTVLAAQQPLDPTILQQLIVSATHGLTHQPDEVEMPLRQALRTGLRRRLLHGPAHEPRSTYELVFLMLAFATMVLLASPPLVRLVEAINGS